MKSPPVLRLKTASGEERSLFEECVRDENGDAVYPPYDKRGYALPFYNSDIVAPVNQAPLSELKNCEYTPADMRDLGSVRDGYFIRPMAPEFRTRKEWQDPTVFGWKDIARYTDVPVNVWNKNAREPWDEPECRNCEHAKVARGSTNGAQIMCAESRHRFRKVFPACDSICYRRRQEMLRGEAIESSEQERWAARERIKIKEKSFSPEENARKMLVGGKEVRFNKKRLPPVKKIENHNVHKAKEVESAKPVEREKMPSRERVEPRYKKPSERLTLRERLRRKAHDRKENNPGGVETKLEHKGPIPMRGQGATNPPRPREQHRSRPSQKDA